MVTKKQNNLTASIGRSLRSSNAIEDLALKALMVLVPSVAVLVLAVSAWYLQVSTLPITGRPSMAIFISPMSGLLALFIFVGLYHQAIIANQADAYLTQAKKPVLVFDALSLGLIYALIVIALTIAAERVMAASFYGLQFDIYTASILIGVVCGLVGYCMVRAVAAISSKQIVNILAFFLVGGVTISMLTAQNDQWWQANFSTLGQATQQFTFSYYAFNLTLVLSALAIIVLARHLYSDMSLMMKGGSMLGVSKVNAVRIIFVVAALGLAGVGLFQYDPNTIQATLHVVSAGLIAIAFGALMVLLRWLLPGLSASFMTISYIALAALVAAYVLFNFVGYLSLTAFELSCFGICFGWLYLFTQQIMYGREALRARERGVT